MLSQSNNLCIYMTHTIFPYFHSSIILNALKNIVISIWINLQIIFRAKHFTRVINGLFRICILLKWNHFFAHFHQIKNIPISHTLGMWHPYGKFSRRQMHHTLKSMHIVYVFNDRHIRIYRKRIWKKCRRQNQNCI